MYNFLILEMFAEAEKLSGLVESFRRHRDGHVHKLSQEGPDVLLEAHVGGDDLRRRGDNDAFRLLRGALAKQ